VDRRWWCSVVALGLRIRVVSLHDALPISAVTPARDAARNRDGRMVPAWADRRLGGGDGRDPGRPSRSTARLRPGDLPPIDPRIRPEEHKSELQSREKLVCRLLLERKDERI